MLFGSCVCPLLLFPLLCVSCCLLRVFAGVHFVFVPVCSLSFLDCVLAVIVFDVSWIIGCRSLFWLCSECGGLSGVLAGLRGLEFSLYFLGFPLHFYVSGFLFVVSFIFWFF